MASLAELREKKRLMEEEQRNLDKAIAEAEEDELMKARGVVSKKIEEMTEDDKRFILDHMKHDCSSCKEGFTENGYSWSREHWRCRKCMLTEIFNGEHGGRFDFDISVDIYEVRV
jgi:hypothetical protein